MMSKFESTNRVFTLPARDCFRAILVVALIPLSTAAIAAVAIQGPGLASLHRGVDLCAHDRPPELVGSRDALQILHRQFGCELEEAREFEIEADVPILLWVLDVEGLPAQNGSACIGNAYNRADLSALLSAMRSLELPMLC